MSRWPRATNFYRDRVAALLRKQLGKAPSPNEIENPPTPIAERSLFDTLRAIHAKRAETLLATSSPHPLTDEPYPLFPDADLFLDCGEVIGVVAASHHWPIQEVDSRFGPPRTPPAAFTGWAIDELKLACILRAADACAIDERRARTMPFLLVQPSGVSRDHWAFQAYVKPAARRDEALVFESKIPFSREDMSAWWTAYDAISVADRELRECDRLIRARATSGRHPALMPFAARRVDGANDPERLSGMLRVSGWTPVDTAARIENPLALIETLGGWGLYGDDVSAPVRELIQNAADAVRAKRTRAGAFRGDTAYSGRIDINLDVVQTADTIKKVTITVADDGIGMSPDIMTGALLDFGRSFWSTEDAAKKYPGLLSDPTFQPTGRYGIGFYAIFMIAEDVKVLSRPWDAGPRQAKVLHFKRGVSGRAELRDFNEAEDGALLLDHSSVVRAVVNRLGWISAFASLAASDNREGAEDKNTDFWDSFERAAAQLVFPLDVACRLNVTDRVPVTLNQPGILDAPPEEFVDAYNQTFAYGGDERDRRIRPDELFLVDGIRNRQGQTHTRGVVDQNGRYGRIHIGGLCVFRQVDSFIKGITGYNPGTAARSAGSRVASREDIIRWGAEQLRRLEGSELGRERRFAAIMNLASKDIDVTEHAMLTSDEEIVLVKELVRSIGQRASIFVALRPGVHVRRGELSRLDSVFSSWDGYGRSDLADLRHDFRIGIFNYSQSDRYASIQGAFDSPTNQNSGYAILLDSLRDAGYELAIEPPAVTVLGTYSGPEGGRGHFHRRDLTSGSEIQGYGLVIHVETRAME